MLDSSRAGRRQPRVSGGVSGPAQDSLGHRLPAPRRVLPRGAEDDCRETPREIQAASLGRKRHPALQIDLERFTFGVREPCSRFRWAKPCFAHTWPAARLQAKKAQAWLAHSKTHPSSK